MRLWMALAIVALGCGETKVRDVNEAPFAQITSHEDGDVLLEGATVSFQGNVTDADHEADERMHEEESALHRVDFANDASDHDVADLDDDHERLARERLEPEARVRRGVGYEGDVVVREVEEQEARRAIQRQERRRERAIQHYFGEEWAELSPPPESPFIQSSTM